MVREHCVFENVFFLYDRFFLIGLFLSCCFLVAFSAVVSVRRGLCVFFVCCCFLGTMTPNNTIMYNIQAVFNLLPNLNVDNLAKAFVEHSNDVHLVIYISSIVRALGCWSLLGCREVY